MTATDAADFHGLTGDERADFVARLNYLIRYRTSLADATKVCRVCGEEKPVTEFAQNRNTRLSRCKKCDASRARALRTS